MAQTMDGPESLAGRANELYWSSSMTVEDIVADLGISRSGMYAAIEPIPADLVCVDCQERMVHSNRTMRDRGIAECPNCGRASAPGEAPRGEGDAWSEGDGPRRGAPGRPSEDPARAPGRGQSFGDEGEGVDGVFARWSEALSAVPPQRLALVGGAAGLGIVAGAALTHLLRD